MIFYLIGIDYKGLELETRESIYRLRDKISSYWRHTEPDRADVLSTCNRVEIYGVASNIDEAISHVGSFKKEFKNLFKSAYVKYGRYEVLKHGLRLACGLESQLQGEYQILQQLRAWHSRKDFSFLLKEAWNHIILKAEEIRREAGLGEDGVNISELIFRDLKQRLVRKDKMEVLVIGTGKIAALIARKGPGSTKLFFVARKKRSKAKQLADLTGGETLLPEELSKKLVTVDAIISATSSPHYVLFCRHFNRALRLRKRPLYVYDLAMPRDVAPDVQDIPFVTLQYIDGLIRDAGQEDYLRRGIALASKLVEEVTYEYKDRYTAQPACIQTSRRDQAVSAANSI